VILCMCCRFSYIVCFWCNASEKLSKEVEWRKIVTKTNKRHENYDLLWKKKKDAAYRKMPETKVVFCEFNV